jgi:hypothetical protein
LNILRKQRTYPQLRAKPTNLTYPNREHCTRIRPGVLLAANRQSHA